MMPARLYQTTEAESIMKRSLFNPAHPGAVTAICIAGICTVASVNLHASDIQTGRYSMVSAAPTQAQAELLEATVTVQLPDADPDHRRGGAISPAAQWLSAGCY